METDKTKDASEIKFNIESKESTKTGETDSSIRKNEPASTSSITSSSPNKDKAKGIPVGIAAYAAAAAAAAARAATAKVKTSDDKKTDEAGKVDQAKSGLSLVSYSRSPSTSPVVTDDDEDSKSAISSKSVAKITSPITIKETKVFTPTINPAKLDDSKNIFTPSSSNVERKIISLKPSGVSPIKSPGVSPIKPSGVSPMNIEASKNQGKPELFSKDNVILKAKSIIRSNISIPKVEVSSAQQNVSNSVDKTKIPANKINESSQSTSVDNQSLASKKRIDVKVNAPESLEKESDTSRIIKIGSSSPLPKTESSSNIKYATDQVTNVSIKPKVVSETDKAITKQVSQTNISKTSSQIKVPIVFSSSSENKTEKQVAPDTTQKVVPLNTERNRPENLLGEKSKVNVSMDSPSVSKVGDLNKTEIHSLKLGIATATPIKDKSLEVKYTPMKDKSPEVKGTPMKDKSPEVKDTPMKDKSPEVKDTPLKVKSPEVKDTSMKDKSPEVKDTTMKDKSPEVKDTPTKDKSPEVKDTPLKDKSPKVRDTTMKDKSPEVKDTPMKDKSPEVKEKAEKTTYLNNLGASQQMISTSVSPNIKKPFPKAGTSSTMPVDPNQGKKEAIKRPCPDANEENEIPDKREKKEEVVNKEKVMEVKDINKSNSASVENLEKNIENDSKKSKEDSLSNGDKAVEDSNDIEMKDQSNDMDTIDEESLDDMDIDKVHPKEKMDKTETPTPSEEADEEDKNTPSEEADEEDEEDKNTPSEEADEEDKNEEEEDDEDDDDDGDGEEEEDDEKKDEDYNDEENDCATPTRSSRRKKQKLNFTDRQRGYGGKFLPDNKPELSALLDENARMNMDEDSQSSITVKPKRQPRYRCEVVNPESTEEFTAEKVVEYVWPLEGNGEHYFIQEQISQYLDIKSLKRKYPDLRRRQITMQERDYLKEKGYVSEMACDLGLTPVRSEDVLDVMCNDFPSKFEELSALMRDKQEKELREKGKVDYSLANIDKSKMQEYARKAAEQAARWNSNLNKERREERRYSFDLSSFTLHITKGRQKILPAEYTKMGSYPVSVLPGQYTDSYRRYSPAALHTLPLSTVTADPLNEHDDLGSDGEDSAPEEEMKPLPIFSEMPWIYSKGANTPNKENVTDNSSGGGGVRRGDFEIAFKIQVAEYALTHTNAQAERKFQTSEANVRRWKQQLDALRTRAQANGFSKGSDKPEAGPTCKHCSGNRQENKAGRPEPMLNCATCKCHTHLTCVDLTTVMIPKLESYKWQCIDCKTCMQCNDPDDAEKMIFCDMCDRGYHIYCVGLKKVPNGRWQCKECAICSSCKSRTPQGDEHIKNAEWQHEFKKDAAKQLRYAATLCIPCDRFWKKRQFCYICTRVYKSILEDKMVRCANCPKYIHKDGCSTMFENEVFCNICYKSRNSSALNHSRIIAAAKKKMARSY